MYASTPAVTPRILAAEADGVALAAPRGAADAMYVVRRILRRSEAENVADVGNVQAARRDVRADQYRKLAAVKLFMKRSRFF
jgi:hypothetical protein